MWGSKLIFVLLVILLVINIAYAEDVAYVLRSPNNPNEDYLEVFEELELSVDLINDDDADDVDFSEYRMIFVADDAKKLKNHEGIPIGEIPSLIANMFHPEDWYLTGEISLIGSNDQLEIHIIGDGTKKAYTSCCFLSGSVMSDVSLPMFYMTDRYKASDFVNVAETAINDGLKEGVVQYLHKGSRLLDGKVTDGRICFFGITETEYWTSTSRELFKECAEFVSFQIECEEDSDCDDNDSKTVDICLNPGEENSTCEHIPVECERNSDCGNNGFINEPICSENEVVQDFRTYTCDNPGTLEAECDQEITQKLVLVCQNSCLNGECVDIRCENDLDCDDGNGFTEDICLNPGTVDSECIHNVVGCNTDEDCGSDGFVGNTFCKGKDVYRKFESFTCNNPGATNSICSSERTDTLVIGCAEACAEGACVDIACFSDGECQDGNPDTIDRCFNAGTIDSFCSHGDVLCISDADCGSNIFVGNLFCVGDDKYQNFLSYECVNSGLDTSFCTLDSNPEKRDECEFACVNSGICVRCNEDLDCNDGNNLTFDACNLPGTLEAHCVNLAASCNINTDCGQDVFEGNTFCSNEDVYRNLKSFSCSNGGSINAVCTSNVEPSLFEDCEFGCSEGICLGPKHDVALVDFSGSVNKIKLEFDNGTDILGEVPRLYPSSYKIGIRAKNEGNFIENLTFEGDIFDSENNSIIEFTHNKIDNQEPEETNDRTKTVDFSSLEGGLYEIRVKANIGVDTDPQDNSAVRLFRIGIIKCSIDSDCDDGNDLTFDKCINPSEDDSRCENTEINCAKDLDCGVSGFVGEEFCSGDVVHKNFKNAVCNNPRTLEASCSVNVEPRVVNSCDFACFEGACVRCNDDLDCNDSNPLTRDLCILPGSKESYCQNNVITECNPGETRSCGISNVGECKLGVETCGGNGRFGVCVGAVNPRNEICDRLDNDCDNVIDESFNVGSSCTVGVGECRRTGSSICTNDGLGVMCNAMPGTPTIEICDNKDNNCDGTVDEGGVCVRCGNNIIDAGEICDGESLGGKSCESLGFDSGVLGCRLDCSGFDVSGCAQKCDVNLDVMLLVDKSKSMIDPEDRLSDAKAAGKTFVDILNPNLDKAGLVSFSIEGSLNKGLTNNFVSLKSEIDRIIAEGATNMGDGILKARNELNNIGRDNVPQVMILLSDGEPTLMPSGSRYIFCGNDPSEHNACTRFAIDQANLAKGSGIKIYTIGLGIEDSSFNEEILRDIASDEDKYISAPTSDDLLGIYIDLAKGICNDVIECGNGIVEVGEICDDGILNGRTNFCNNACSGIVRCYTNNDCNDGNNLTSDICILPGSVNSRCENNPIGECNPGETRSCGISNVGECKLGVETCGGNGRFGVCVGAVNPRNEICDRLDNDCDNVIDESFNVGSSCTVGIGECRRTGSSICTNDGLGVMCNAMPGTPTIEICDNKDNNCDGTVDEGGVCLIGCYNDINCGVSGFIGEEFCSQENIFDTFVEYDCINPGNFNAYCKRETTQKLVKNCNDICVNGECKEIKCDSNADCSDGNVLTFDQCINPGTINSGCENTAVNCASNLDCGITGFVGEEFCSVNNVNKNFQTAVCNNPGSLGATCTIRVEQRLVNTCNFACFSGVCVRCNEDLDCNDSNPLTRDLCILPGSKESYCQNNVITECNPGETRSCGISNVGECKLGVETCGGNGRFGVCVGAVNPRNEICDRLDNDCDNVIDESFDVGSSCTVGIGECRRTGSNICTNDGLGVMCNAMPGTPTIEICDNKDNNCDGTVDEGGVCGPFCTNNCIDGSRQCVGEGYKVCRDYDGNGCTEWSGVTDCGFGRSCHNGYCS